MSILLAISDWLLLTSLALIVIFGIEDGFKLTDWLSVALFVFALPVYLLIKIILTIEEAVDRRKRRKRREQLRKKSEEKVE